MKESSVNEATRYDSLPRLLKLVFIFFSVVGIASAITYLFGFSIRGNPILLEFQYYWLFIALFGSCIFLLLPARKKDKKVPWYDFVLAVLIFGISVYFYMHAWDISLSGWSCVPLGIVVFILILEGGRRTGGPIFAAVCVVLGFYPLFASYMPGMLYGQSWPFMQTIESSIFRVEGLMGIPTKVVAEILVGFLIFAGVLIATGAGEFFLNIANAIFGRFRGGPAKVAVAASGFFGSLSGSVYSNIIATGSVTIPTMKRIGYPAHYAGAIEACASTGGVLMPPVMGAVAFVMCEMIGVEYGAVIVAAAVPSILYYFGLLMQVDAYAGKVGLKGLPRAEIPSLKRTLAQGWQFIFVFIFLLWGLLYMRWSYLTPYYATGLMIILSFIRKETMMTPKKLLNTLVVIGRLLTQAAAVILPIGFIMCGLIITGVSGSFTAGLVSLGMGNIFLILILGVVACYIMGMAGMTTAAYIFLAVSLAPAVIKVANLNTLAVHLFIIYYAMLAGITLPVAASAFLAGTMAGASLMRTALTAMRLAIVIYFIPFFFVFDPALVLQGSPIRTLYLFVLCLIGITFIAAGCEGYLLKFGVVRMWARLPLVIAGLLIGFPEWWSTIAGAILVAVVISMMLIERMRGGDAYNTTRNTEILQEADIIKGGKHVR
ncbi:TRAP transporter fused permease subunit [Patescibacteria group bacterium]|nr:TRAP transporter fused permease subunit [Patescibacteria group bacterium]